MIDEIENMIENQTPPDKPARVFWKWLWRIGLFVIILGLLLTATAYAGSQMYAGVIGPGIKIGPFSVGGLDQDTAREMLYDEVDTLLNQGLDIVYEGETANIPLTSFGAEDPDVAQDYVDFDIDTAIAAAYENYHHDNPALDALLLAWVAVARPQLNIPKTVHTDRIETEILDTFPELAEPPINAGYEITWTGREWVIEITEDSPGVVYDIDHLTQSYVSMFNAFSLSPIKLLTDFSEADISVTKAENLLANARTILEQAPYILTYSEEELEWELLAATIASALEPQVYEDTIRLSLNQSMMQVHLDAIAAEVEIEAQDAHFAMSNSRVTNFVGSHDGIELQREETLLAMADAWEAGETEAEIVIEIIEPRVTTDQVNDLGINEVLGVGTSDFRGSPYNRILNIKHGASKLNGLLIAPDEEFSLLEALKPFTVEDGYLPELVIRGDKIEPEVGGGLCQIGTTTFRTTMNSGLPVTQRSNHSLVVSYYNDPTNGNPGTDATIYDPAPDFRFLNDSGNYVLFTTYVDTSTYTLTFTFWGTNDGRNGYYTPPTVTSWIGYGETEYVDTEDLEPGEEECQHAYIGANANFTYYIERPDGEVEETEYSSHYRSLPEICLVGIDPEAEEEETEELENLETEEQTEE